MKKLDEMDRKIQLRSEEIGYKITLLILSVWTFYDCWQVLANGAKYSPLPGLIVCFAVCIQGFSQMAMNRKMIAGDDEYHEPNKLLWTIVGIIAVVAILLSVGTWFLMKA
ncbi:MAG: hypothetical protein PHX08_10355 [Lachnospiraceae bacterium]|nr:hypothetical protein [Lachnospiraceae bacterium]